ncbi:MAG TPA: GvpL/GvpF family gas vesicle protein, partial [Gemmatimonadaceae bacterium]
MAIYLYCLTEPGCEPPAELRGLAGEAVRAVAAAGRVAAWVSDLPEGLGPATTELARAHDRVVRAALAHETPLPARFGQSFAGDAALRRSLDSRTAALERALERVRGGVEMTVRVLLSRGSGPETTGTGRPTPPARGGAHTPGEVEGSAAAGTGGTGGT